MGTSQRHSPTISGQPNWGKSSSSLSAAVKNLEKLEGLDDEIEDITQESDNEQELDEQSQNASQEINLPFDKKRYRQLDKKRSKTSQRFESNIHKSVKHLIKASGGKARVSSGTSHSLGHAGVSVIGNVLHAFADIRRNGLGGWLASKGESLTGKTWNEIRDLLFDACSEDVVGLDETAANQALNEMLDDLSEVVGKDNDEKKMEDTLQQQLNDDQIKEIIDKFFGVYIFAHLSQNFEEKLEKKYSQKKVDKYIKDIKDQIISDVREGVNGHNASNVDWKGEDGYKFMRKEFEMIISAYDDDND